MSEPRERLKVSTRGHHDPKSNVSFDQLIGQGDGLPK